MIFNELIENHELSTLISEPKCFKDIHPTCIETFLKSKKTCFMNTLTFETSLSDHHKFIGPMLRSVFADSITRKYFSAVTKAVIMKSSKKN